MVRSHSFIINMVSTTIMQPRFTKSPAAHRRLSSSTGTMKSGKYPKVMGRTKAKTAGTGKKGSMGKKRRR